MRDIPTELKNHLQAGVTHMCHVWRLTRSDGLILGFTDHDRVLDFQGLFCPPSSGFIPSETEIRTGLVAATGAGIGVLDDERLSVEDIQAGLFDQAKIEIFRVNWQDSEQYVPLYTGWLGDMRWSGQRFEVEWRGPAHGLSRSTGRVFSRLCDAELGDARCGLNLSDFPKGTVCPHTFAACRDQFDNVANFRGFPYLLGEDALISGPKEGEPRDGGSRYGHVS